jgi:hypothetical protein
MLVNINSASLNGQGAEKPRTLEKKKKKKKKMGRVLYHRGWAKGRAVFQAKLVIFVVLLLVVVLVVIGHFSL